MKDAIETMTSPIQKITNLQIETDEAGEIIYPESDGKPMADNTQQFQWIATIQGNLDSLFENRTDVFVAGDLLWYPEESFPNIRVAPDVMVAFGRPKGNRGSYQQWKEDNIAPQVVFEILSPSNTPSEMLRKERFYAQYGVQEYYVYDPKNNEFFVYARNEAQLTSIPLEGEPLEWTSPLLQTRFVLEEDTLRIYNPEGKLFLTYVERAQSEKAAWEAFEREQKAKEEERKAKEEERKAKELAEQTLEEAKKEEAKTLSEKEAEIAQLKALMKQAGLDLN